MKERITEIEKEYGPLLRNPRKYSASPVSGEGPFLKDTYEFGSPEYLELEKKKRDLEKEVFNIIQKEGVEFLRKFLDYSEEHLEECTHYLERTFLSIFEDRFFNEVGVW